MGAPYKHVFGPVPSRRLGLSLGVDLNPRKVCSEDCVFCQVGATTVKTLERKEWVDTAEALGELRRWAQEDGKADYVTLSGDGEPTLHSRFGEVLREGRKLGYKTALLSNGSLMHLPEVRREAAACADVIKVTLSAWDEESFRRIHRPALGLTFADLLEGERALRREFGGQLWVEVMVLRGVNDAPEQVEAVAARVAEVRPDAVHLNTLLRPALTGVPVHGVPEAWLETVAEWFEPRAAVPHFKGRAKAPAEMDDDEVLELLERHPLGTAAWAKAAGVPEDAVEARLAGLVAAGRVAYETCDGQRVTRVLPQGRA